MDQKPPLFETDKPGVVRLLIALFFVSGCGWGAFIWWLLNRYFWVQP